MNIQFLNMVPAQYTGEEIEVESTQNMNSIVDAKAFYAQVKSRLFDVNNWHNLAGILSAVFKVVDSKGAEVVRLVQQGDFLKIDIPGPGSSAGSGYDWVKVEDKNESEDENLQFAGFTVRPCFNPMGDKVTTAHFYSAEATSSFIVSRIDDKIRAMIFDRNLKPNDINNSITDKLRDTAVGISARASFSKAQWQKLADGLLKY